jgi:hypothetical protein
MQKLSQTPYLLRGTPDATTGGTPARNWREQRAGSSVPLRSVLLSLLRKS